MVKLVKASIFIFLFSLLSVYFVPSTHAMCPMGFPPPRLIYEPDDNTHGLLVYKNGRETLILEPSFHGSAKEFGLVLPVPSKPNIEEAPTNIFTQLNTLTQPPIAILEQAPAAGRGAEILTDSVIVVEQKDVGDYTTTTLIADSSIGLTNWLDQNGYTYNENDRKNFDYYVQQGGFYFVAMKVNMAEARVDARGFIQGKLRPISFAFKADEPMLPLRSMAGDMPVMTFDLYVISDTPYYIPGVDILYSQKLTDINFVDINGLDQYGRVGDWLIRHRVVFNPAQIQADLDLLKGDNTLVAGVNQGSVIVNPHLLPSTSGILPGTQGTVTYVDEPTGINFFPIPDVITDIKNPQNPIAYILFGVVLGLLIAYVRGGKKQNYTIVQQTTPTDDTPHMN